MGLTIGTKIDRKRHEVQSSVVMLAVCRLTHRSRAHVQRQLYMCNRRCHSVSHVLIEWLPVLLF